MYQASFLHGLAFDPFSFQQDGLTASEVDVGRSQVVEALVVAVVIVVFDKPVDGCFKITGEIIAFQHDPVLQRLVPTLDFTLGLRMMRGAANVLHALVVGEGRQISGDVT